MTASSTTRARARLLAGAALVAGVAALLALSGCGSGQLAQTALQQSAIAGVNGSAGLIALRNALIPFNGPDGYPAGGTAPIAVSIFNNGENSVKLVDVIADDAADVVLIGGPVVAQPSPTAAVPQGSPTAAPSPSPGQAGQTSFSIPITSASYALLAPQNGTYLQMVGLKKALPVGSRSGVQFKFDDGSTVNLTLPVGPATNAVPRQTPVVNTGSPE